MFKGIITDIGTIIDIKACSKYDQIFHIKVQNLSFISKGDSIACSGVCLTVIDIINDVFIVQVSQETMKVTNLNSWKIGKKINLEQAMRLSDRVDGHIAKGHIDKTVQILAINQNFDSHEIKLSYSQELIKFIVKKGSVMLDGVSLTVNSVTTEEFVVNVIPYTWQNTTFQYNKVDDYLNLEIDIIVRYLDQLMCYRYS